MFGLSRRDINRSINYLQDMALAGMLVMKGEAVGYQITCPYCAETYQIGFNEFHYEDEVICMKCKSKYLQRENIVGIEMRKNIEEYK